jgi:NDP-sugar pyrophosphorylase family protein
LKAFILAAGLGTRLKPITDSLPKALVEVDGKPLLRIVTEKLIKSGFDRIIINLHHFAAQIIDYVRSMNSFGVEIVFSDETGSLLDTGGGLKKAAWFLQGSEPFLVHNVDILTDLDLSLLLKHHSGSDSLATLAVQNRISSRYFLFDGKDNLCGWENEKSGIINITRDPSGNLRKLAFSGIHAASPNLLKLMPGEERFSLVDLYLSLASYSRITYFEHTESYFLDLGKIENLAEAEKHLKTSREEQNEPR